jgi:diguanylate cyclase (GGDEF)-like protein
MACWSCKVQAPADAAYCSHCGSNLSDPDCSPIFVVDGATELFNNVFLHAVVGQEVTRAVRYRRPLSVMVVEIDHGPSLIADLDTEQMRALLRELGNLIVNGVRDTDTVGFLDCSGAPHFGVVMPETDYSGAILAADKLRSVVAAHSFVSGGKWERLTASVGTATVGLERSGEQDLLEEALAALATGRERGAGPTNHTFLPAHV